MLRTLRRRPSVAVIGCRKEDKVKIDWKSLLKEILRVIVAACAGASVAGCSMFGPAVGI